MLPLIIAGGMAALSVAGSITGNKQAKANAGAQAKMLLQNFNVTTNSIKEQANELNKQSGIELTKVKYDGLKASSTTTSILTDKGIAGGVSERLYNNIQVKEALATNVIKQGAEANMSTIQDNLTNAKFKTQAGMMSNEINRINNSKSSLGIVSGAVSSGLQGYMAGKAISK